MRIKAWQAERDIRRSAVPLDRRLHPSSWSEQTAAEKGQDEVMFMLWESSVPGSGAPECLYREAAQSMENQGFDESVAVSLIPEGSRLARSGDAPALRVLTAHYLDALFAAPQDPLCSYLGFEHPALWDEVLSRLPAAGMPEDERPDGVEEKTLTGWVGQLAGGAFGTAIEGYTGQRISEVYGDVRSYVTDPETMNDDVVYELAFLTRSSHMDAVLHRRTLPTNGCGKYLLAGRQNGLLSRTCVLVSLRPNREATEIRIRIGLVFRCAG